MSLTAPALLLKAPEAWAVADPGSVVWTPDVPDEAALGVLAPALSLDVTVGGDPVTATASVVISRADVAVGNGLPEGAVTPAGEDDVRVEGRVDLPLGVSHRVQTFWRTSPVPGVPAGPRVSVQYLVPHDGWLVALTFDTASVDRAEVLVDAFDQIALRATWASAPPPTAPPTTPEHGAQDR